MVNAIGARAEQKLTEGLQALGLQPEAAKLAVETALAGVLLSALARLSYPAIKEAQLPQGNKTEHDPKMAASAVMIALVKMRCQQHLRYAIEEVRSYRERSPGR